MAERPTSRWRLPGPEGLRGVVASLADGIMVVDGDGRIRFANPAACALFGRPMSILAGADFGFPVRAGEVSEIELLVGGASRVAEMRTSAGRWNGDPVVVVALRDVTGRARALSEIEGLAQQALHDPLTGLPNRSLVLDRLRQALARCERSAASMAVMFVDLDDFKAVNDRLGHDCGDQVLRSVAQRLRAAVRPADTVGRLGGDEFVVVCEGIGGLGEAQELADRVEAAVAEPCRVENNEVALTASVGLVVTGANTASPRRLLADADAAMYVAKQGGKARHQVFDDTLRVQLSERARLEHGLSEAIDAGRLDLVYQPIITLDTGAVCGAEALLRYDDPDHGLLPAAEFMRAAEDSGLIVALGTWALEQACREAAEWWRRGWHVPVTVNLGAAQLARSTLVAAVRSALEEALLPPAGLHLDLAEAAITEAAAGAIDGLGALAEAGVGLGIDDWGSVNASLTDLARLPLGYVKLDPSLVAELASDRRPAAALVAAAGAVGVVSIAEGVESAGELEILKELGCTAGQGDHLAPALAPAAVVSRLATGWVA